MASIGRPTGKAGGLPDGALLRFALPAGAWAESIPPVPAGATATVIFSSDHAEAEHGDALRLLGYAVLGVLPQAEVVKGDPDAADAAELVISREVLERHSTWFRSLLSQSTQAFDLSMGPALLALRDRWGPHLVP